MVSYVLFPPGSAIFVVGSPLKSMMVCGFLAKRKAEIPSDETSFVVVFKILFQYKTSIVRSILMSVKVMEYLTRY